MSDNGTAPAHHMTALWAEVNRANGPLGVGARVARKLPLDLLRRINQGDESALAEGRQLLGARQRRITRGADAIVRAVRGPKRERRQCAHPAAEPVAADAGRRSGLSVLDHAARVMLLAIVELGSVDEAEAAFPRAVAALRRVGR